VIRLLLLLPQKLELTRLARRLLLAEEPLRSPLFELFRQNPKALLLLRSRTGVVYDPVRIGRWAELSASCLGLRDTSAD
jgi:hypothetical protein